MQEKAAGLSWVPSPLRQRAANINDKSAMPAFDRLRQLFRRLIGRDQALPAHDQAALRESFRENYQKFRSLLAANNNALELMAEMEQMLASGQPFGMTFVRSRCTALGVNVFKMIRLLQDISGGSHLGLSEAFHEVSGQLHGLLEKEHELAFCPYVLDMREVDRSSADLVGEKMANLGEIGNRVGLPVPKGFVVTACAVQHFLAAAKIRDEINRRLTICHVDDLHELHAASAAIQQLIVEAQVPMDLELAILDSHRQMAGGNETGLLVAMRSSALGEDSGQASFAGQHRTRLNVGNDMLIQAYKDIIAGKYASQAIVYRLQRGYRHQDVVMCVGCLAMVDARAGGVVYSRSPTDPRSSHVVVVSVPGTADHVVDGKSETDLHGVERMPPFAVLSRRLRPGAVEPVLSDQELAELTQIAVRLEAHFGLPQDIEWTIDRQNKIVVLQSRPLTLSQVLDNESAAPAAYDEHVLLAGGETASRGTACGPAFLVRSQADLLQFPQGSVLAVEHPLPEWASLLPSAAAVIGETGQAAAHLATVAREFGVPALFGVKGAMAKLENGQMITVDANACRIHAGRIEALLAEPAPKPNLMQGSPVHTMLSDALRLIAPLNLTDPASVYFRPSSCRTFHDLTRFCHEKAVSEMFSFGTKFRFAEKTAKQLVGETPFQWWVINLDDGFVADYDCREKFIGIHQIASEPMLALWGGMTAMPWQGPPPLSVRGFGSILFQSTMNRELDPAVRSGLTDRNCFMASKNFCSLSVRLGYHFALAEAHVSDLLTENYVSFQFKGGAAEQKRRIIRAELIKAILEQSGFRVEQKSDALVARIERKPSELLLSRLRILGHLVIHTRQIDMVMDDPAMVEQYRRKILADIKAISADRKQTQPSEIEGGHHEEAIEHPVR